MRTHNGIAALLIYSQLVAETPCYRIGDPGLQRRRADDKSDFNIFVAPPPKCVGLPPIYDSEDAEEIISFIAMGDVPYNLEERYLLNVQLRELSLLASDSDPHFMVHVGDIKSGESNFPCDEKAYNDIGKMFTNPRNSLGYDPRDCFFVPGDNEWTDCESSDSAWKNWNTYFGPNNPFGFGTFSTDYVQVERQSDIDRSENFAFFENNVLFVGLNMVMGTGLKRNDIRFHQNLEWVTEKLRFYSETRKLKAAVLFGHSYLKQLHAMGEFFSKKFQALLREQYPDLPVLYVHGDWHEYCVRSPDPKNPNLHSVELDDGGSAPPVLVSILQNRADGRYFFSIDRRGGPYFPRNKFPQLLDATWRNDEKLDPLKLRIAAKNYPAYLLGNCQGECDSNSDCQPGLRCFRRRGNETVPGCTGEGLPKKDYCIISEKGQDDPTSEPPIPTPNPTYYKEPPPKPLPTPLPTQSTPAPTLNPTPEPTPQPTESSPSPTISSTPSPTAPPTSKPTFYKEPPPRSAPKPNESLVWVGINPPDKSKRLGLCEGDCDFDGECKRGLVCFKRNDLEAIPGCPNSEGAGKARRDYCSLPPEEKPAPEEEASLKYFGANPHRKDPNLLLGPCEGDCDSDADCQPGLLCFDRKKKEGIPGCPNSEGSGKYKRDYCYLPNFDTEPNTDSNPGILLGPCEGNCNSDSDCQPGLRCLERNGTNVPVPGCPNTIGAGVGQGDYCYDPTLPDKGSEKPSTTSLVWIGPNPHNSSHLLGPCEGDCDDDSECESGLRCFKRNGTQAVPGCRNSLGAGVPKRDYCTGFAINEPPPEPPEENPAGSYLIGTEPTDKNVFSYP